MRRIQIIQNLRMHRPRPQRTLRISNDRLMNGRLQKQLARDLPPHTAITEKELHASVIPWGVEILRLMDGQDGRR